MIGLGRSRHHDVALGRDRQMGPPLVVERAGWVRRGLDGVLLGHERLHVGVGGRRPGVGRGVVDLGAVAGVLAEAREHAVVGQGDVRRVPAAIDHLGPRRPRQRVRIEARGTPVARVAARGENRAILEGRDPRAEHVVEVAVGVDERLGGRIEDRGVGEGRPTRKGVGLGRRPGQDAAVGQVGHRDGDVGPRDHGPPLAEDGLVRAVVDQLAVRGDRLEARIAGAVPDVQHLATVLLEELDAEVVHPGRQGRRVRDGDGTVQSIVVDHDAAVDVQDRAVVRVREELVVPGLGNVDLDLEDEPEGVGLGGDREIDRRGRPGLDGCERREVRQLVPGSVVDLVVEVRGGLGGNEYDHCEEGGKGGRESRRRGRAGRAGSGHSGGLHSGLDRSPPNDRTGPWTRERQINRVVRGGRAPTSAPGAKPRRQSPTTDRCL